MRLTLALATFLKILHLRKKKNFETQVKTKNINELKEGWKDKPLHGKYPNILENGADPKCRVCDKHTETIDHLMSGCSLLAPTTYLNWNDRLGQHIHWCLCKIVSLPHESNKWEHIPPKVIENKNATISWDFNIHTEKTIQENRPHIVVRNHNDKTCFVIDMSVPSYNNVSHKIFEKLSKYKDLEIVVTKMWHLKTTILPVVIGALGMVTNTAPNYILQIPGSRSLTELQKVTLIGTAHILRKILSI